MLLPALAQDSGSLRMTLGVDQRFEAGDNLSFRDPPDGDSAFSSTKLRFGLSKTTTTDRLDFFAGGALRLGDVPIDVSTGFVDPNIGLDYSRIGANALFSIGAGYRESDVSFNQSLTDFENEDGVIVLPPDFADVVDFGTRQVYRFDTSLQSGLNDPFCIAPKTVVRNGSFFDCEVNAKHLRRMSGFRPFYRNLLAAALVAKGPKATLISDIDHSI